MTFKHGKDAAFWLGGAFLSPYLNTIDLGTSADAADTTVFGSAWKTSVIGTTSATIGFSGFYDPSASGSVFAVMMAGYAPGALALTWAPSGASTVGDACRMAAGDIVNYNESVPVGGVVAMSGTINTNGTLSFGQILHPSGEDTNTTTGASKDDSAASATGWTAHLHVLGVDGGSWVVKLEDSADNSTWADVSAGAFSAMTTAGTWERKRSAAATTALRRYVRYTATRSGGSAGDGITFLLAYSRSY